MKRVKACCLSFFACLLWASIAFAGSWDLYKDMNIPANPNGAWSYGMGALLSDGEISLTPDTSTLLLFTKVWDLSNCGVDDVGEMGSVTKLGYDFDPPAADALIVKHTTEIDTHPLGSDNPVNWRGVPPGQCGLMPGWPGRNYPVVARWTSPEEGAVRVHGSFGQCIWGQQSGRWIKHNSTVKFSLPSSNESVTFDFDVTVAVGDIIDFIATQGSGTYNDITALTAQIESGCDRQASYLDGDLSQDCYVDFSDYAMFTQDWLKCNDVENPECIDQ